MTAAAFGPRTPAAAFGPRRPAAAFGPRRPAAAFGHPPGVDRRTFLLMSGCLAGGALLGGCSDDDEPRPDEEPVVTRPDRLEGDLSVAALLVSLENLMISVYQEGLDNKERIGELAPGPLSVIETALRQHREHAAAWNSILTGAGKPGITGVNLNVKAATSDPALFRMRDPSALLSLGQDLESLTGSTYLAAIGAISNNAALKVAASIQVVEMEHAAVLAFLLGRTPAPEGFARSDGARPITDTIG